MRKALLTVCAALVALVSCEKQPMEPLSGKMPISFDLDATHPDGAGAKAVKADWEDGDMIFVVFSGADSPHYLKMTFYDGGWINTPMEEDVKEDLPLAEGDEGTMTAIFVPFANDDAFMNEDNGAFLFHDALFTYYLTASLPYIVSHGKVSGTFDMQLPEGFVQFYIKDDEAVDGKARLWEPHLKPVTVTGVADNGTTLTFTELDYGAPVPGYAYEGGYIFSGILAPSARNNPVTYTFSRYMGTGFVQEAATATPHIMRPSGTTGRAANITGSANLVWNDINTLEAVDLGLPSGNKWANLNLGAASPTDFGAYFAWGELYPKAIYHWENYLWGGPSEDKVSKYCQSSRATYWAEEGDPDNEQILKPEDDAAIANWGGAWRIPTRDDCDELRAECNWFWQVDYLGSGTNGYLIEKNGKSIFLPAAGYEYEFGNRENPNEHGYYWTTSLGAMPYYARKFYFYETMVGNTGAFSFRYLGLSIRPVQ